MLPTTAPAVPSPTVTSAAQSSERLLRFFALIVAAISFALYPLLRGSAPETGLSAATLYARPAWLLAHCLGMAGFITASWGLGAVDRIAGRLAFAGTQLVLPYYGAEAFGLNAIGRLAVQTSDPSGVAAADMFRYQPVAMTIFAVGLLLLAATGVRLLLALRNGSAGLRNGSIGRRVGLVITGLALVAYLPQFFVPMEGRIVHGLVLAVGLLVLAGSTARRSRTVKV